jgi:gamma-glutamyl-gamma-aminobutyrate hydrolase PuuD
MKKRIGIVGWPTGANSFGATLPYLDFFSNFGVVEIIMPNETNTRNLDLLILPGGPDVDTSRYIKEDALNFYIGKPCPFRERFDNVLLPKYINERTPIFGICRGHQSLAVYFKGDLYQDMDSYGLGHETNPAENRIKLVHSVVTNTEFLKNELNITSQRVFEVNSIHHQCVSELDLPQNATVVANYTNKIGSISGVVEAISYYPNYPAHTVQWHPEEIRDRLSISLIENLLDK